MSRNSESKFQVHLSSTKAMFQYMTTLFVHLQSATAKKAARSKSEQMKLENLYTQGGGAYSCVRNLVKAKNLLVKKVRQFLHSKTTQNSLWPKLN